MQANFLVNIFEACDSDLSSQSSIYLTLDATFTAVRAHTDEEAEGGRKGGKEGWMEREGRRDDGGREGGREGGI